MSILFNIVELIHEFVQHVEQIVELIVELIVEQNVEQNRKMLNLITRSAGSRGRGARYGKT